jgi:hypothetical protein
MTMPAGTPSAPESAGVQAYILERQADLLARAIDTIVACPPDALAPELHRMSGTLGTYQLTEARMAVQDLEAIVRLPKATAPDVEAGRIVAVARLRSIASTQVNDTGAEPNP